MLLPTITPEMISRYPDQTSEILNRLIRKVEELEKKIDRLN